MNISDRLVGSRSRECVEQFYQTRLVRITHGAFAIWLDPFGMFLTQRVVDLALKLNVLLDSARKDWRSVGFHQQHHRRQSIGSEDACVGFCSATPEVICPLSFGIPLLLSRARARAKATQQQGGAQTSEASIE